MYAGYERALASARCSQALRYSAAKRAPEIAAINDVSLRPARTVSEFSSSVHSA